MLVQCKKIYSSTKQIYLNNPILVTTFGESNDLDFSLFEKPKNIHKQRVVTANDKKDMSF